MTMNNWTISRRVVAGFATMLLIIVALGVFALWRMMGLAQNISVLADGSLPSVLTLKQAANVSRDNLIYLLQIDPQGSAERNTQLEQKIAANTVRRDELLKAYESQGLISDDEDRRLFDEVKRARETMTVSRSRSIELLHQGKADEARQLQEETVIPDYDKYLKAIDLDVEYNAKLGQAAAQAGKTSALFSVRLIGVALGLAFLLTVLLAWQVIRSTNRALNDITVNLDRGALQTASAARQVSMASQTLASGASEQAASVEETSTSLEEMSSMIRATAENAEKAKDLASEARSVAAAGSRTMAEMTHAMAAIDSSSAEVAKIVKNIDEIAFQTNILALNAAVEAARAGEAGAGFAVVADEVRSLAQRSAAAAKETADKIEAAIANSRKGSQCSAKVEESLTQIAEKVSSTDSLVAEIATAAREQAQGIEQINAAIAQMDKVSQSNSASAEESASAAEELDAQAETLKDLVAKLRLLVGGQYAAVSASPVSPPRLLPKMTPSITNSGRRAIPMPGDAVARRDSDDGNFRNF
jgi:methyl-accepting chemotaxis protein